MFLHFFVIILQYKRRISKKRKKIKIIEIGFYEYEKIIKFNPIYKLNNIKSIIKFFFNEIEIIIYLWDCT